MTRSTAHRIINLRVAALVQAAMRVGLHVERPAKPKVTDKQLRLGQ